MTNGAPVSTPIPRMPGHPLFGNLPEIRRDRLGFFLRVCEQCGGIGQYRRMTRTIILLAEPAHIQTVLVDQAANVGITRRSQLFLRPILGDSLLTSDNATHTLQRARVEPAFQHDRVAHLTQYVAERAQAFQRTWSSGATIDVFQEMLHLALEL